VKRRSGELDDNYQELMAVIDEDDSLLARVRKRIYSKRYRELNEDIVKRAGIHAERVRNAEGSLTQV